MRRTITSSRGHSGIRSSLGGPRFTDAHRSTFTITIVFSLLILRSLTNATIAQTVGPLPGTQALVARDGLSEAMQQAVDRFLLKLIGQSGDDRSQYWDRDHSSVESYSRSVEQNRQRFRRLIGVADPREPFVAFERVGSLGEPPVLAENGGITVRAVRWPVFPGVNGEGLLLEPKGRATYDVIALPDADWTPEILTGIDQPPLPGAAFAKRLAEAGGRVLVPTLISRDDQWSGNPEIRMLNQPHREFIYRPAFYLGRHIIGHEVQKVLSAVDYFARQRPEHETVSRIGVAGYGEGALIAFYSAAVDERIAATLVSGYFDRREGVWREPIYRNVWGLLREFGDADIASLVAPRGLVVEACRGVEVSGPPKPHSVDRDYAASGALTTPAIQSVRSEFARAQRHYEKLKVSSNCRLVESGRGGGPPGTIDALQQFIELLGVEATVPPSAGRLVPDHRSQPVAHQRQRRQVRELVAFNQTKYWESSHARKNFWEEADRSTPDRWTASIESHRQHFLREVVGDFPIQQAPLNPRTRVVYETEQWVGYEVVLDVTKELWSYGILLVPRSITKGEKRPVVVAQHGRGGRPQHLCDPAGDHRSYHSFGARLADRGFIVYAPQNLYFGEERYRLIQRKANALGMSFFAPMVWQHRAAVRWLNSLPFVDSERIAFYGLSYGGKSALLLPAVMEEYSLSICSGAFTDAVRKHIDSVGGNRSVFLFTGEYEHLEFDFAERFNHAEIAWLISPRPFMVEKGHRDGGLPDEWTAYEYARVRRHYVQLGIPERTEIEFFDGGHEINQQGSTLR